MIFVPEHDATSINNLKSETRATTSSASEPTELPPVYFQADSPGSTQTPRPLPGVKPCNFLSLSRPQERISGKWIIDPALYIPPKLLPPLSDDETEATRKNLSLVSHDCNVDAEIFVMPGKNEAHKRTRIFIYTSSKHGSVSTKVHEIPSNASKTRRLPLSISSYSANGHITIFLPRSFRGIIIIKRINGSLRLSSTVEASLTPFSDVEHTQRGFLGQFDPSEWEDDAMWTGDELSVEARNGNVNIFFDDEPEPPPKPKSPGFFERLFAF